MTAVDDKEKSSAIGSAVVLRNFIRIRGAELFHAVPEIVQDSLAVSLLSHFFRLEKHENFLKFPKSFTFIRLPRLVQHRELNRESSKH